MPRRRYSGWTAVSKMEACRAAIPGNVDETDKSRAVMGAEMAEAAGKYRGEIRRPAIAPDGEPQLPQIGVGGSGIDRDRNHK